MKNRIRFSFALVLSIFVLCTTAVLLAGYKARTWTIKTKASYPASLTSEGVTIAVNPLFNDELASQVFDKNDMIARGIMPLAIIIFNDNDYGISVDAMSIELIRGEDHFHTLTPAEVENRLYGRSRSLLGRTSAGPSNKKALEDFEIKFLDGAEIAPHGKGGGFVYIPVYDTSQLAGYLSTARVYIPNVYRQDNGSRLIFFEINLTAAFSAPEETRPE